MSVTFYPKNEDKRLPANKTAYARTLKPPIQYQKKSWGTFQRSEERRVGKECRL